MRNQNVRLRLMSTDNPGSATDLVRNSSLYREFQAERNDETKTVVIVGIQTGGVHLARRLAAILEGIWNHSAPVGAVDVSMHRDDLGQHAAPNVQPTNIPFDLNGKTVILVDDVLFSG